MITDDVDAAHFSNWHHSFMQHGLVTQYRIWMPYRLWWRENCAVSSSDSETVNLVRISLPTSPFNTFWEVPLIHYLIASLSPNGQENHHIKHSQRCLIQSKTGERAQIGIRLLSDVTFFSFLVDHANNNYPPRDPRGRTTQHNLGLCLKCILRQEIVTP